MRKIIFILLLLASGGVCASVEEQMEKHLAWLISKTGYKFSTERPIIAYAEPAVISAIAGGNPDVIAVYPGGGVIVLPFAFLKDPKEYILVHELVHFLQDVNGVKLPCVEAYEKEAYELTNEWIKEFRPLGVKPTDAVTIFIRSLCMR